MCASTAPQLQQAAQRHEASEAAALKAALRARQLELDAALGGAATARAADGGRAERLKQQLAEAIGAPLTWTAAGHADDAHMRTCTWEAAVWVRAAVCR